MTKRILVAVDFSDLSTPQCCLGCQLAQKLDAELHLLHVAAPDPDFVGFEAGPQEVRDTRANTLREEHRTLEKMKAECEAQGAAVTMHLLEGVTADTIVETAENLSAGLILLGSHGHSAMYNTLLGSVSHAVLKKSATPVMFLPAKSLEQSKTG